MYSTVVCRWATIVILLIGMWFHSTECQLTTRALWQSCDTVMCGSRNLIIQCERDSKILINNVTSGEGRDFDLNIYINLRRICMGMNKCNASGQGFCSQFKVQFTVSYVCVPGTLLNDDDCYDKKKILTEKTGFITNPSYPSTNDLIKCKWEIKVPPGHYVHVYLHEVLYTPEAPEDTERDSKDCDEGLRFSAVDTCGMRFPTHYICHETEVSTTVSSCSDMEIVLPKTDNKMRFLLSYAVVKAPSIEQVSIYKTEISCLLEMKPEFEYMVPAIEDKPTVNVTIPIGNATATADGTKEKQTEDSVDYVMIIGFAVGILVIVTIIVIALIYLRCRILLVNQERQQYKMNISQSNSQSNCEIQKRPLPEAVCVDANEEGQPVLQQSYSEVKDHIPISARPSEYASPTYAEIEEFESSKPNPKLPVAAKRSVDNSKRELPAKPNEAAHSSTYSEIEVEDAKDADTEKELNAKNKKNKEKVFPNYFYKKKLSNASNIYAECEDVSKVEKDKTYIDMSHKKIEESEYVPHSKDSKDKVNQSKKCKVTDKTKDDSSIPFADSSVGKKGAGQTVVAGKAAVSKGRKDSVTSESDSDICIVENELYEPFETAKV